MIIIDLSQLPAALLELLGVSITGTPHPQLDEPSAAGQELLAVDQVLLSLDLLPALLPAAFTAGDQVLIIIFLHHGGHGGFVGRGCHEHDRKQHR